MCQGYFHFDRLSPDGQWVICEDGANIIVFRRSGEKWIFSSQEYFGDFIDFNTLPVLWTRDGQSLYFALKQEADYVGPALIEDEKPAFVLLRMDLSTGNVYTILPTDQHRATFYWFSFSPTEETLAWRGGQSSLKVWFLNLNTGNNFSIQFDSSYQGASNLYSWSEDGTKLFVQLVGSNGSYLAQINILSQSVSSISAATPFITLTPTPTTNP